MLFRMLLLAAAIKRATGGAPPSATYAEQVIEDGATAYWRLGDVAPVSIDDGFAGADNDPPNPALWSTFGPVAGGTGHVKLSSDALSISCDNVASAVDVFGATSTYWLSGDFDVQIDFSDLSITGTGTRYLVMLASFEGGGEIYTSLQKSAAGSDKWAANVGAGEIITTRSVSVGKLRLARSGSTTTAYQWSGSSWTSITSGTTSTNRALITVRAQGNNDGDSVVTAKVDNYTVNSGTIECRYAFDSVDGYNGLLKNEPTIGVTGLLTGDANKAMSFDGVDQIISIPGESFDLGSTFSLEAWGERSSSSTGSNKAIIAQWDDIGGDRSIWFGLNTDNKPYLLLSSDGGATNVRQYLADASVSPDVAHHYVATFSSDTCKLYVDGAEVAGTASGVAVTSVHNASSAMVIGGVTESSDLWDGTLDEVAIYPNALLLSEISDHYDTGVGA